MSGQAIVLLVEGSALGVMSLAPALQKSGLALKVVQIRSRQQKNLEAAPDSNLDTHLAPSIKAAFDWVVASRPDLIVFDTTAMRSHSLLTCRRLRRELEIPLIHCRAAGEVAEVAAAADVYLVHPFTPRKLLNRIRALLPANDLTEEIVRVGDLTFYVTKRSVQLAGRSEQRLTPKLAALLEQFLRHPNEVLGRRELIQTVWQTNYFEDTRTLDVHIRWVRELIEANPARPRLLKTVRSVGYILRIPPDAGK
jgi:DNA-binding response OmpR family regulator